MQYTDHVSRKRTLETCMNLLTNCRSSKFNLKIINNNKVKMQRNFQAPDGQEKKNNNSTHYSRKWEASNSFHEISITQILK